MRVARLASPGPSQGRRGRGTRYPQGCRDTPSHKAKSEQTHLSRVQRWGWGEWGSPGPEGGLGHDFVLGSGVAFGVIVSVVGSQG